MASIKLYRGAFGHVSMLNVASDLVTHAHPEAHLIVWLDGAPGQILVGETAVTPGPGIAVGVNSLEPHSHSFPQGSTPGLFLAFYLQPEWAHRRRGLKSGTRLFDNPAILLERWQRDMMVGLFDRLAAGSSDGELDAYEIERSIDLLIDAADAVQAAGHEAKPTRTLLDFRVRKAIELMRGNVSGRISLDQVARSVGLSRPHFFALFKEQMGITPNVYWNTLRMEEALRHVETGDESLTAVACNLGFTTQGNFTRFFRDHAGVPPTLYREASRSL